MGLLAVNFFFECFTDDGEDISGTTAFQMDAFYCYGGRAEPPSGIRINRDRTVVDDHTGETYDPFSSGTCWCLEFPRVYEDGKHKNKLIGVLILNGIADVVRVMQFECGDPERLEAEFRDVAFRPCRCTQP